MAELLSSRPIYSSPIRGRTKAERAASRKTKNSKHQSARMTVQHATRRAEAARKQVVQPPSNHPHANVFRGVLDTLRARGTTFRQLFLYIMDPVYRQGNARYNFLGSGASVVDRALALFQRSSKKARTAVYNWTVASVSREMRREAKKVTQSKLLQTHHRPMDGSFFTGFNLASLQQRLASLMPTTTTIFTALAFRPKYAKKHGEARQKRRSNVGSHLVVFTTIVQGLSEWSQKNNLFKKVMSLYMYATGAQRQQIEVLSHLGLTETYSGLVDKRKQKKRKKKKRKSAEPAAAPSIRKGTVRQLSDSLKLAAQKLAESVLFGATYDNVNFISRVIEQIVGRTDAQENGTCATIFELFGARLEDMKAETLAEAFDIAAALKIDDILHSPDESRDFRQFLIWTILRIIVLEGGEGFKCFRSELAERQPGTSDKIEVHKTKLQPTPAWKIDQSSITGNAEFIEAFYEYLGIRTSPTFSIWVRLMIGDQLSIARLRSLLNIRAGQEGGAHGFRNFVLVPGLFHAKIADTHGFFATHWGKPNTGNRVAGSLWYHNTVIQRLPITLTSLPPFRTCRDLIWISLYSRVLHCLLLVSGQSSLEDVVDKKTSLDDLLAYATAIYDRFLDMELVDTLRSERAFAEDPEKAQKGDMVYENAVLFLRDALISREFADAIKCGDSGRVMLVLKIWALSYRGSGRTKYAYEMLTLIHHVTQVWPKAIVKVVMNNWLVNTTGNPNSFLEGDLLQEHMNFWIKNFYRAHGSNASWDWLEMLAPCVVVLRDLTRSLNGLLGARLGKKHKSPDHSKDLAALMNRLEQHDVYIVKRGRVIDPDDGGPVTDIIGAGLTALTDVATNPIDEYNTAFRLLQTRCRLPVLVPLSQETSPTPSDTPSTRSDDDNDMAATGSSNQMSAMDLDADSQEAEEHAPEPEEVDEDEEPEPETLALDTEEDVALDMDDMGVDSDQESDASDGSSSGLED
ncbi:hypothetical protein C8F01DRAFT_1067474 [Mycena amicta]|nr:hypothetical protein C8F01DRAFT_1067474 [Mycena amicta]